MKKLICCLSWAAVCLLAAGCLAACGRNNVNSSEKEPEKLPAPTEVSFDIHFSKEGETEYWLTWTEVENASGYALNVNGEEIERAEYYATEYDLTEYLTEGKTNTVTLTVLGKDGFMPSDLTALDCEALVPTAGLKYERLKDSYEVSRGDAGFPVSIVIPDYYNGYAVKSLGAMAFGLEIDVLGGQLTETYTKSVRLPNRLETMGEKAFAGCAGLTEVVVPDAVKEIGAQCFCFGEGLKTVKLPSGLVELEQGTFTSCVSLEEVILPDSLKRIGPIAFEGCSSLKQIRLPDGLEDFSTAFSRSGLIEVNIPDSVQYIKDGAFMACYDLKTIDISFDVNREYVSWGAFSDTEWKKNLPEGWVYFGDILGGYQGTLPEDLRAEDFPKGVKKLAGKAFYGHTEIKTVALPQGLEEIWAYAFRDCVALESAVIPEGVKKIDGGVFNGCRALKTVALPGSLKELGNGAFDGCALKEISLPEGLETLGSKVFYGCPLKSVRVPNSVKSMGGAFRGCKELESVTLPKNLEAIESNFFFNCKKLAFVELPKTVKDIGYNAFSATSLESITLPKSVERLDVQFLRGSNITALYYEGTETDWDEIFFYNEGVFKQDVTVYYYSEEKPPLNGDSYEGHYWRYVDGVPTVWEV